MKKAFSLVELSIVLVILGLLVGGILAGQSLIRAAELRSVVAEYQRYNAALYAFRDRYFVMPGDFNAAQSLWGQSTACGGAVANGTCNGNSNGIIETAAAGANSEIFQLWRHMAMAGLLEGSFSGVAGASAALDSILGVNVPRSRLNNAGWGVRNIGTYGGSDTYTATYNNFLMFGAIHSLYYAPIGPALKPEEAWNIDTKLDDGKPGTGGTIAYPWGVNCTNASSQTDYAATYKLDSSALGCALYFPRAF